MTIRYDDERVKRPSSEYEYTPNEINELVLCSNDFNEFFKFIKIVHPDKGEIPYIPYDYQKELLNLIDNNRYVVALFPRQSGKTTTVGVYALWYSLFNENKVVGIVSNKEASAKMILSRIKRMYESIPVYLKPGVTSYAKTMVEFDNGTKIVVSATSPDAFRGETINFLLSDEAAFVPKNQVEEFWASNFPTLSASKESKIVVISTPNGLFNLFHRLYSGAENGTNTFKHMCINWRNVPGRDKKWAQEQIKNMGVVKFNQEFEVKFLGSTNTVIEPNILEMLIKRYKEPILTDLQGHLYVYEKPVEDAQYVLGVDTAKGTGEHLSAIQILKIESINPVKIRQVAVFYDNNTDVYRFTEIINRLSYYYNRAWMMVESNSEGAAIVNRLWWEYENDRLVNSGSKNADLGVRASTKTKPRAVLLMKKLIEDGSLEIVDKETIDELSSFVEINGKFFGKDKLDDCVSALYWATYFLEMGILDEKFKFKKNKETEDAWGIIADISIPEEDWSWL